MKMNMNMMLFHLHLLLFLLLLSVYMSAAAAAEAPDAVVDIYGKQVRAGVEYYIVPVVRGSGGGLTMTIGNKTCDVSQERSEVRNGVPVSFHPVNPKKRVVRVSTDHNIKFSEHAHSPICVQSTVWKLDYEESTQKYVVTTGGMEGKPGPGTISNWFKIQKFDSSSSSYYKLVFCPTVCNYCKVICRDVSISVEQGAAGQLRRLIVNLTASATDAAPVPFKIMFKEAAAFSKINQ